jgi:hypothetical protein
MDYHLIIQHRPWMDYHLIFKHRPCFHSEVLLETNLPSPQVVAMTGDCMGDLISPPDCAADITSFIVPW